MAASNRAHRVCKVKGPRNQHRRSWRIHHQSNRNHAYCYDVCSLWTRNWDTSLRPRCSKIDARLRAILLAALAISAGCLASAASSQRLIGEGPTPNPPIVVTRDDVPLPRGCAPRAVATFMTRFLDDVSRGNAKSLRMRIAPAATRRDPGADARDDGRLGFRWYSVNTAGKTFTAYTRSRLLRYFVARHRQRERMRLIMIDIGRGAGEHTVAISVVIRRTALDLASAPDAFYFGKAEFNCGPLQVYVWSIGGPQQPPPWPCPTPSGWTVEDSVIACTRS
jgi:hypothetical protein